MARKAKLPHYKSQKGSPVMLFVTIGVLVVIFVAAIVVAMAMPEQSRPVNNPVEESQQGSTSNENTPLAEDDPTLWLTEDELAYTLPEELEEMVHQRMKLCKAWLTEEELAKLTPQQKYDVANQRKQEAERETTADDVVAAEERLQGLDQAVLDALMLTLAETEEAEWVDIFEQLKPVNRAQLKADANGALNGSRDFDYLEDEAREAVIIRMMVTPREDWLSLLRQILKEDADLIKEYKEESSSSSSSAIEESSSSSESSSEEEESEEEESSEEESSSSQRPSSSSSRPSSSEEEEEEEDYEDEEDQDYDDDLGTIRIYNLATGRTVTGNVFDIVSQVVQNEMGSFHQEALKAQAVAAYSFILHENNAGRTPSLRLKAATSAVEKATKAVLGEYLAYNGKAAFTPFYATSAGATNSSADVWGGSYPYLVSVDSSVDENAKNFEVQKTISVDKVRDLLEDYFDDIELSDDPDDWFEVLSYTDGGYNKKMRAGDKTTTGRILRESVLSLRSAAFEWECDGEDFVFTTYGYGHGVGMSQTGANEYAKDGWTYDEILDHYYPGTTLR